MKKTLSVVLLISCLILLIFFVACEKEDNTENNLNNNSNKEEVNDVNNNELNNNEVLEPINDISDKIEISYIGINTFDPEIKEYTYVLNHLQDKFNIELEFSPVGSEDKQSIDLLISADTLPDCGWVYSGISEGKALGYYTAGAIRSIPEDLVLEYAPNFAEMISTNPANRLLHLAPDKENEFYCFFANRYGFDKIGWALVLRYDWMQNLNMVPKGNPEYLMDCFTITDEAYTIDEFSDIIYEFTFSDPDMNSENDTIGYVTCKPVVWDHGYSATIMSAYGLHQDYMDDGTGWGVPVNFSPQAKKAYIKINEWIDNGVLPSNLYNSSWAQYHETWASGHAGVCTTMINNIITTNVLMDIKENVPEVELLLAPGLVDNDGTGGRTFAYTDYEFTPGAGFFFISSKVEDDEKLKRILMLYDYMCLDTDGVIFCNYGDEGVHYERNALYDIVEIDQTDLSQDEKILWEAYITPGIAKALSGANPERQNLNSKIFAYSIENWPPVLTAHIIPPTALEIDLTIEWYSRENKKVRAAAESEFIEKVFTSQGDVDAEWDNLMNVLDAVGYEGYLIEMNTHGWLDSEYRLGNRVHPIELYPTHE